LWSQYVGLTSDHLILYRKVFHLFSGLMCHFRPAVFVLNPSSGGGDKAHSHAD